MSVYAILKGVTMDKSTLARSPLSANLLGTDLGVRQQDEVSSEGSLTRSGGTIRRSGP
jgi:hypothetical protein